jgi:hypothetical protein
VTHAGREKAGHGRLRDCWWRTIENTEDALHELETHRGFREHGGVVKQSLKVDTADHGRVLKLVEQCEL